MKSKTLIVMLMICGVLAAITYFVLGGKEQPKPIGKLFDSLEANDIAAIRIISTEGTVSLKKADIWQVENRYGFPASFSMITDFVRKLKELKNDRSFKASEDTLSRLAIRSPDEKEKPDNQKGTRVILEDKDKKVLADFILGSTRETPSGGGGHYLKFAKQDTIHLADKNFRFLDKDPSKWLDKELMKAGADEIESVTCADPKTNAERYSFKRAEKGKDPEMANMPADKKLAKSKVNSLFGAISSFQTDDVADPSKTAADTGVDNALAFEFRLFDGRTYRVSPGKALADSPEKYYFKIDAAYSAPPEKPANVPPDEKPEDKQKREAREAEAKKKQEELAEQAKTLNQKFSAWTFVIPKWRYDNFISEPADFFEKEKPAEEKAPQ